MALENDANFGQEERDKGVKAVIGDVVQSLA